MSNSPRQNAIGRVRLDTGVMTVDAHPKTTWQHGDTPEATRGTQRAPLEKPDLSFRAFDERV